MAPPRLDKSSRSTSLPFLFLDLAVADADAGVDVSAATVVVEADVGEANATTPDRATGAGNDTTGEGGARACRGIGLNPGGWSSGLLHRQLRCPPQGKPSPRLKNTLLQDPRPGRA